jgi:hypothetical protein
MVIMSTWWRRRHSLLPLPPLRQGPGRDARGRRDCGCCHLCFYPHSRVQHRAKVQAAAAVVLAAVLQPAACGARRRLRIQQRCCHDALVVLLLLLLRAARRCGAPVMLPPAAT